MRSLRLLIFGLAAGFGLSGAGCAQTLADAGVSSEGGPAAVQMLPDAPPPPLRRTPAQSDPYAPPGFDLGGLTLHAALGIAGVASSNVTQETGGGHAGAGLSLKPSLAFASDWSRHSWTGEANADLLRYAGHADMAASSASARTDFRLDIRRGTTAEFSASYDLDAAAGKDSGIPGSEIGDATVHTLAGTAGLSQDFGPWQVRLRGGVLRAIHEDSDLSGGGRQVNGDRDYVEPSVSLRLAYAEPPVLRPFVEASYAPRLHLAGTDRNGLRRDSQGFGAKAGVAFDDGPIWSGELALSYLRRDYEDAMLGSNGAWGLVGAVNWNPTELTQVVLSLGFDLTESTTAGFSGGEDWTGRLDVTHAMRDDLDLKAGAGVAFEQTDEGLDATYEGSLGLLWTLNRRLALTTGYAFTWLDAALPEEAYAEHRLSAGVILQN